MLWREWAERYHEFTKTGNTRFFNLFPSKWNYQTPPIFREEGLSLY